MRLDISSYGSFYQPFIFILKEIWELFTNRNFSHFQLCPCFIRRQNLFSFRQRCENYLLIWILIISLINRRRLDRNRFTTVIQPESILIVAAPRSRFRPIPVGIPSAATPRVQPLATAISTNSSRNPVGGDP